MKKFLWSIYNNWFFISLATTILGKFLGIWSAWWILIPLVLLIVLSIIAMAPCFSFLRFITWPLMEKQMKNIIKNVNSPILGYPLLVWMTFEGKKIYIDQGDLAFRKAFSERADKVGDAIKTWAGEMGEKKA